MYLTHFHISVLSDKIKRNFSQADVVSILLYKCTTWTLTKRIQKKKTRRTIVNKSWKQHPTRNKICTVTYISYLEPSKSDEQDMQDTAAEGTANSSVTFFPGLLHIDVLELAIQQERTYNGSVWTHDVVLKTCWER